LLFVAAHQAVEAAHMAGEMSAIVDPAMQKMALLSPTGAAFAARILGLMLVATPRRTLPAASVLTSGTAIALCGSLLIATSFTLMGHTTTTPHRWAAASLIVLHLLFVAFWLGSLWPLYLVAKKEAPSTAGRVIDRFSATAACLVPLILLAGIGLSALLLPSLATFQQPYGQLLLVKLTGFTVLMAIAALNKWRFGPACAAGNTAAFERTIIIECALLSAVLTATAIMTTFYSPDSA
jgi:putative copper resistance protein D